MKKIFSLFLFLVMCSLTAAFGQLKVTNNFGYDLNISIGSGVKQLVPNKATKNFPVRGRSVWLECQTVDGKIKFTVQKAPTRSGVVWLEPGDGPSVAQGAAAPQVIHSQPSQNPAQSAQTGTSLQSILKEKTSTAPAQSPTTATPVNTQAIVNPAPVYAPSTAAPVPVSRPAVVMEPIKVIYTAAERCKVFSDIGGSDWQGLEFKGTAITDSLKDNAKNEYDLYIQKNRDLHIGFIFNPEGAINEYGEFRKRVNKGDTELYINEGDIKKMSTSEKKPIRIHFMAKDNQVYFDPGDVNAKGQKDPISLEYKQRSRRFMAPIGQFYIKASCTDANGMFHPTVYIPVHVTNLNDVVVITTEQINKALGADLNLDWSKLRGE